MTLINKRNMIVKVTCYVLSIFLIFICSCSSSNNSNDELVSIDLHKVIQEEQEVPISQFVDNLEYIPLELTPESVLSQGIKLYLTEEFIIVNNSNLISLFDRKTGKFIHQIGERGKGPEEYMRPLECFYNPYNNCIYAKGERSSSIKVFNLEEKFLESFEIPTIDEPSIHGGYNPLSIEAFLDAETFIGYIENSTGMISNRLAIFSKDEVINSFPNFITWSSDNSKEQYVTYNQNPKFFSWENSVSFKEGSNDTLFSITQERLIPRFVLNSGENRVPYKLTREEAIRQFDAPEDYFEIYNIFENANYLFFDLISKIKPIEKDPNRLVAGFTILSSFKAIHNFCIFDKKTKNTFACINNDETINSCLTDDINNFLPIAPIAITENNELVAALQAIEIEKWKNENPNKLPELSTRLPWLDEINETNNPVIVIAKCKQ